MLPLCPAFTISNCHCNQIGSYTSHKLHAQLPTIKFHPVSTTLDSFATLVQVGGHAPQGPLKADASRHMPDHANLGCPFLEWHCSVQPAHYNMVTNDRISQKPYVNALQQFSCLSPAACPIYYDVSTVIVRKNRTLTTCLCPTTRSIPVSSAEDPP